MRSELMIAVFAGLGGMLGWGVGDFFAKKTIDAIGDVVSLAWAHVFGTIILFALVLYNYFFHGRPFTIPHDPQTWLFLVFFGVLQATVYLLVYKGFGQGQVAVLNPVFASFSGLTAVLSILIFKESVSGALLVALAIIFAGVLLLSLDFGALRNKVLSFAHVPGFKEVALATLFAAFWTLFWDRLVNGKDWLSYALFMYIFMTIAILIVAKARKIKLMVVKPGLWKFLILIGVCETLAYASISWGYGATSRTSVVALLSGAFSLPTIILARIFLKEKVTRAQTIGSMTVIAGIILLALFNT